MTEISELVKDIEKCSEFALSELKFWTSQQSNLPALTDKVLQAFLHSCYYNVQDTKNTILSYYALRTRSRQVFLDRNMESIKSITDLMYFVRLPGLTEEGYKVIVTGLRNDDVTQFSFFTAIKFYIMTVELWSFTEEENWPGLVIVTDTGNFTLSHLKKTEFSNVKAFFQYLQDALPVRLKKIVLLNVASAVNILLNMVQPIISKKLGHLIEKHGRESDECFCTVSKNIMPAEFGGQGPSINELQKETLKQIEENEEWFAKEDDILTSFIAKQPRRRSSVFDLFR